MKKVIFAALLVASIGTLSSFRADSVANKKEVGTADNKKRSWYCRQQKRSWYC